jgi:ParB-like chromosome segregation protein Spo0J
MRERRVEAIRSRILSATNETGHASGEPAANDGDGEKPHRGHDRLESYGNPGKVPAYFPDVHPEKVAAHGEQRPEVISCASLMPADSPRIDGESLDHIAVLAEARVCWPPIIVHRHTMRVIDGMHRLRAAQSRGDDTIEVKFFDGDAEEAFVAAVRANIAHGLPLTLADRKAAAQRILVWQPGHSDRWIGQVTGLAAGTIAAIRRDAGPSDAQPTSRLGRDGRLRPLNAADGRLRALQQITAHPDASLREIADAAGISPATAKNVRDLLRRGDAPYPKTHPDSQNECKTLAGEPSTARSERPQSQDQGRRSLDRSLHRLACDPSLRYSDSGRRLLRWLEIHARGPGAAEELIDAVPAHCGYVVAEIARQCARQWLSLADALEHRLNNQTGA